MEVIEAIGGHASQSITERFCGVLLYLPGPSVSGRGPAGSHTIPRKTKEPRDL